MTHQGTLESQKRPGAVLESVDLSLATAGRSYNNIREVLVDLPEIAASIRAKTAWNVDLSTVPLKVVSQQELHRHCADDVAKRTSIPTIMPKSFVARTTSDTFLHAYHKGIVGMYLPSEGVVVINEERLQSLSRDAVKSALHRELTHAAQHKAHPEFMRSLDALTGELRRLVNHGADTPEEERTRRKEQVEQKLHARRSLVEAQAVELQKMYEKEFNLHSEVKIGPVEEALGLSSMLIPGMYKKILEYVRAQEIFTQIHAFGTRAVDQLFRDPEYTDAVFGPKNPRS